MENSVIMIDEIPFYYEEINITYENAVVIDKQLAKEILLSFKRVLDNASLPFLLMHGTLLGAVREHNFIEHDIDIDVCVSDESSFRRLIPILKENNLYLCRYQEGIIYSFIRGEVYIDVYIAHKASWWLDLLGYCYYCGAIFPKKYIYNVRKMNFLNEEFLVPSKIENLLRFWYGKTWRIPIKDKPSEDSIGWLRLYLKIKSKIFNKHSN
ncbi:LicD family protein [Bacteroides fragilis]|uniref:LicD family protein n=1 Tax=Bacteroides fragilis TaxID=817 RepID=UPI00202FC6D2|nr:LicD family protein [Bacteroides fragilis]MCM0237089.1 LicD family protein [Bacteroides fragilis]